MPLPKNSGFDPVAGRPVDHLARVVHERASTIHQIEALTRTFDNFVESAEFVATDDEHDPEGHTIAFERQQIAGLLREAHSHLGELDDAAARFAAGTYGRCERCRCSISSERLAVVPATRTCIACAR